MAESLKEECGVLGIFSANPKLTAHLIYNGLLVLQHRGQESSGFAILEKSELYVKTFMGYVTESFPRELENQIAGNIGIGHVRYSTAGSSTIENAGPCLVNNPGLKIALAHNGNIVNFMQLRRELIALGREFNSNSDSEVVAMILHDEFTRTKSIEDSVAKIMQRVEGAYCIVALSSDGNLIAFRDPNGFRPLFFGENGSLKMIASETVALDSLDMKNISEVKPGELIIIDALGNVVRKQIKNPTRTFCMFELVYFSRPDSLFENKYIHEIRVELGRNLARQNKTDAEVIVPVPDTSRSAAEGISEIAGIPVAEGLIKNRYVHRTFIMPDQKKRDEAVKIKLNVIKSIVKDKKVLLVDDSIVRGTTLRKIVRMMRDAGAKKIEVWITCPPIISPCFYGIDMSSHQELIAANKSIDEIRKVIEADNLVYQTMDGLIKAINSENGLCTSCLTGKYSTPLAQKISDEMKIQTTLKRVRYWEREN